MFLHAGRAAGGGRMGLLLCRVNLVQPFHEDVPENVSYPCTTGQLCYRKVLAAPFQHLRVLHCVRIQEMQQLGTPEQICFISLRFAVEGVGPQTRRHQTQTGTCNVCARQMCLANWV